MRETVAGVRQKVKMFHDASRSYRALQRHLDRLPIGYPATPTGVEIRLLKEIFTVEEARAALHLGHRPEPFEAIFARAEPHGYREAALRGLLDAMEKKGCIFMKHGPDGRPLYALHPLVIGMYEMQVDRLTADYYMDFLKYVFPWFGAEVLTTELPQLRVIPIEKSVDAAQGVASYDQIRAIVDRDGDRIAVARCICKVGKDLVGDPCKTTQRREICLCFRDYADTYIRNGWGRRVDREEALEILAQNEKDGLVLLAGDMQEQQYVCSCCSCCCGLLETLYALPRPADYTFGNFRAVLDSEACVGCGLCVKRCPMDALRVPDNAPRAAVPEIVPGRCVGCGVCVAACAQGAVRLEKKERQFVPPKDMETLYEEILRRKTGKLRKAWKLGRAVMGMKTQPGR